MENTVISKLSSRCVECQQLIEMISDTEKLIKEIGSKINFKPNTNDSNIL